MAPGIVATIVLSTISIVRIESVSAASTRVNAALSPMPIFISGKIDKVYPNTNASAIDTAIVTKLLHPNAAPRMRPNISPTAHPVKQWSVALTAVFVRGENETILISYTPLGYINITAIASYILLIV
jgi:hypothetical protein